MTPHPHPLPAAIKAGCRAAGVTIAAVMRKSDLSESTYEGWTRRPDTVSRESLAKLDDGLSRMADALLALRADVRARLHAHGGGP